ncbi:phosphonates import ATP-binding protein PhnC 1 [Cupriavidus necator N-1]|jgi:phosphonate transport system ATP-binding protein|uniref:Phosphonates import ATP-binding protein PhnC 1 n=1 Tax=Cupriavidus necator (strain ATCC 43291 / DSM 13513 / CCUG 52238 / LMG 8453 / N-1) TaxID=1042878 RepID=F8GPL4_CUPNN|nr:ATP-binding cassette domain-containing protein [Cupriavidus necator]AEI79296.1 phosphonates import ATP-binding protein PhnC 1 [Cupriavidus necator N-1]KAI3606900.1 ABC transporter, ATP-binding protein (cluster 12, methionine/phosphonates) [Cupriavidus necator H850]MDX6011052.1 ATP-binding cassette domain-containing protein [Cupriavidus necator]
MSFRLDAASVSYANGQRALSQITLAASRGEPIAVIGPSGAGKTSLLRLLATSLRPSEGRVEVLEQSPWAVSAARLRQLRCRIGMVHQAPPMPPRQRVITAILAGRLGVWPGWKSLLSLVYPADIDGAGEQLARLELADRLFDRCDQLSGGQLQRVGVARVLYQRPELILADEPVSAMDPVLANLTLGELRREADTRAVPLVASLHAVDLALRWFPRIVGLKAGEIAFDLPAERVTDTLLRELYASESASPPVQGSQALMSIAAGASAAIDGDTPSRPACR